MDPALKNLREWVALLFALFLVFDIAGLQYGLQLAQSSPVEPDTVLGAIKPLIEGQRGAYFNVYVTESQQVAYFGLLGAAGLSLLATLTVIVVHGIRQLRPEHVRSRRNRR